MRTSYLFSFLFAALAAAACSSTTNNATGGGGGGTGSGSCVPNNNDGQSSCEGHTEPCAAGQYCSINICNSGCLSTANCPSGLFCDMSAASTDNAIDKPIGICRACPTNGGGSGDDAGSTTGGACNDVHGAYSMSTSTSSSQGCGTASGECTVTQKDCVLTLGCANYLGTHTVTIDGDDKGSFTTTISDGQGHSANAVCAVSFSSLSMTIDCQISASGGTADCIADGVKK